MKKWFFLIVFTSLSISQVFSQCNPAFTYQADTNNFVIFTNLTPSNNAFSYEWDFGDGSPIDTSTNPTHQYSSSGGYVVMLSVDSGTVNCGTILDTIYVNYCNAYFTTQVTNNVVQFQNYSTASSASFHYWSFGDGNYSSQKNPTHTYQFAGQYTVTLDVYDSLSSCFTTHTDSIVVFSPPCQAGFSYTTNNDTLFIQNLASNFQLTQYDFGDSTNSSNANPIHIYSQSGSYIVCQTVTDTLNNCSDTFCDTIIINIPPSCQAGFRYSTSEDSLFILNTATNYQTLAYDFGDGSNSTLENPTHIYSKSGVYQVCQTVEDTVNNCLNTFCDSVSITIPPPCQAGFNYQFQGDSTFFQSTAVNYDSLIYFFGDGDSSTLTNPIHQYLNSGEYVVEQKVYNHRNCFSIFRDTIQLTISTSCVAKFELALDTTKPSTLFLVNTSSNHNTNQYFWDFGDGNTSSQKNPTHVYAENKPYPICLTVSDSNLNCISVYCDTVGLDSNGNILKSPGFTLEIIDGSAIGLKENGNKLSNLTVYPNPAHEFIHVDWPTKIYKINYELTGIQGQLVKAGIIYKNQGNNSINLNSINPGLYWLVFTSDENRVVRKLIKR